MFFLSTLADLSLFLSLFLPFPFPFSYLPFPLAYSLCSFWGGLGTTGAAFSFVALAAALAFSCGFSFFPGFSAARALGFATIWLTPFNFSNLFFSSRSVAIVSSYCLHKPFICLILMSFRLVLVIPDVKCHRMGSFDFVEQNVPKS